MDYIEYDKWVNDGKKLFGEGNEDIMYWFLYGIRNFVSMPDAEFRKLLFKKLEIFTSKNIRQISAYTITNLDEIIREIKSNLVTNSHLSLYFLINSLAERICDGIIQHHNESLSEKDRNHILSRIEVGKFSMKEKIIQLEKIMKKKGSEEGQELIGYLELLKEIRNKFMFHFLDNDEYFSFYPKEREDEKDKNLNRMFQGISEKIDSLLNLMKVKDDERRIIEVYKKSIKNVIKLLGEITYSSDSHTSTSLFYRDFSKYFTHISYAFVLFLGRENLKLFK